MNTGKPSKKAVMDTYICRPGGAHSAVKIKSDVNADTIDTLSRMGWEIAKYGKSYRHTERCPVNGDGYWYTRRELTDSNGFVVGSCTDWNGPKGEA